MRGEAGRGEAPQAEGEAPALQQGDFAATTVGPHGVAVRIYERDGSGTAWISYVWEGKLALTVLE